MSQKHDNDKAIVDSETPETKTSSRPPNLLWLVAVMVVAVVLAVGTSYYTYRALSSDEDSMLRVNNAISEYEESIEDLEESLREDRADLLEVAEDLAGAEVELGREVDDLESELAQIRALLQSQQKQLLAIGGSQAAVDASWQQAEIEYLLKIANERLGLAGDPVSALAALRAADQRLAQMADPRLTPVRAEVADEIRALEAVSMPDIEGVVLKIGALATGVSNLPVTGPQRLTDSNDATNSDGDDGFSVDRAVGKVRDAFGSMVSVRKTDQESVPLLSPEEQFFLRENTELQLNVARLSALARDQASYRQSLNLARGWISEYFVASDAGVINTLAAIDELETLQLSPPLPDISASLLLLQSVMAITAAPVNSPNDTAAGTPADTQISNNRDEAADES